MITIETSRCTFDGSTIVGFRVSRLVLGLCFQVPGLPPSPLRVDLDVPPIEGREHDRVQVLGFRVSESTSWQGLPAPITSCFTPTS